MLLVAQKSKNIAPQQRTQDKIMIMTVVVLVVVILTIITIIMKISG